MSLRTARQLRSIDCANNRLISDSALSWYVEQAKQVPGGLTITYPAGYGAVIMDEMEWPTDLAGFWLRQFHSFDRRCCIA